MSQGHPIAILGEWADKSCPYQRWGEGDFPSTGIPVADSQGLPTKPKTNQVATETLAELLEPFKG